MRNIESLLQNKKQQKETKLFDIPKSSNLTIETERGYLGTLEKEEKLLCYCNETDIQNLNIEKVQDLLYKNKEVYIPLKIHYNFRETDIIEIIIELTKWNGGKHKRIDSIKLQITEDIAYLLGVLTGDGGLSQIGQSAETFRISSKDTYIIETIKSIIKKINPNHKIEKLKARRKEDCDWQITARIVAKLLYEIKLNTTSDKKFIPNIILKSPLRVINAYLRGLFDTDGGSLKNGYIEYSSCSKQLANDVHTLLLYNSIRSTKRFKNNSKKGAWVIAISYNAPEYYNKIGFSLERKQERIKLLPQKRNSNWKLYPPLLNEKMKEVLYAKGPKRHWGHYQFPIREWGDYIHSNKSPDTKKLENFIHKTKTQDKIIEKFYMKGNVIWLKIKKIDKKENIELFNIMP